MTMLYLLVAIVLLLSLGGGMVQVSRGPTPGDRLLVIQLIGTAAVAVLILVAAATDNPALVDIALVLSLLAAITLVAFVRRTWTLTESDDPGS